MSLKNKPQDYQNAFASISKGTRFIYIHAYQSYVWNRAVSERLRKFGRKVLIGDLVVPKGVDLVEEVIDADVDLLSDDENLEDGLPVDIPEAEKEAIQSKKK